MMQIGLERARDHRRSDAGVLSACYSVCSHASFASVSVLFVMTKGVTAQPSLVVVMRDRYANEAEPADVSIIVRDGSPEPATVKVALTIQ